MKTLLFATIILITACSPRIQSRGSANEMIVVLSITNTETIELKAQGDFTVLVEYMKVDSLILLHVSGTTAQVVNQKDLKLLKSLIYQSKHDN